MKSRSREQILAEKIRLLELEAAVQRAALIATFATWEERRTLVWGTSLARAGLRALQVPRVRWMLIASALSRLRRRKKRDPDS
ncbi:MAG TPA: hypothetical protein VIL32_01195 [Steroidobacteraceae bacterium]